MTAITNLSPPTPSTPAETHALLLPDVIYELLTHLDFYTLLRCQRVCHTWRSIISRSRSARQTLFLEADTSPLNAFLAAEAHDIASQSPPAWLRPSERIPTRPEFRALFNPWIYTHGCEPIGTAADHYQTSHVFQFRRPLPAWRFTDRVSAGRLDFCFAPAELAHFTKDKADSCAAMFLTQPPVKRVLVAVQGGYMREEKFDVEKDEGVRIGDIMSCVRGTRAVAVMTKRTGATGFTTLDLRFDEHFTGVRFVKLKQLVADQYGNVETLEAV